MSEGSRFRPFERLDDLADALLTEDAPGGDLTTESLGLALSRQRWRVSNRRVRWRMTISFGPPPVPPFDHPTRGLALCSFHPQLSRRRRSAR